MLAFAANSLLCRWALLDSDIDAASFTLARIVSGAITLFVLAYVQTGRYQVAGSWYSGLALFVYAAGFSFAYLAMSTATGALLLFGSVQAGMIGYGLFRGERPAFLQWCGIAMALFGAGFLLLPGAETPPIKASLLMVAAGIAWAVYSIRGRSSVNPTRDTAGNFIRAVPLTLLLLAIFHEQFNLDSSGLVYAVASGALASGVGYALWYSVLPALKATTAATVQLSVPALAAIAGALVLHEPISIRVVLCSVLILGGVAAFIVCKPSHKN